MLTEDGRAYVRNMQTRKPAARHLFRGEWMTAREIMAVTGLPKNTVYGRIRRGDPIEGPVPVGRKPRTFEFRGEQKTAREIAAITGLSCEHVYKRTDGVRFYEREEIADPNPDPRINAHIITFRGVTDTITNWSKRTGISTSTLFDRIVIRGWPVERALTERPMIRGKNSVPYRNRRIVRIIAASFRVQRNAEIIRRIASVFQTGGYERTFRDPMGTGAGRHARHLQSEILMD